MRGATACERRTLCCSPIGQYFSSGSNATPCGLGTPGGHALYCHAQAAHKRCKAGTSCCHAHAADRHLAPRAG